MRLSFIGSGNMATALAESILNKGIADVIIMSDKNPERLSVLRKRDGIKVTTDNLYAVENSDIVFLSVKPQQIHTVLMEIKTKINNHIVVSIAAGISINYLQSILGERKIIRVMPNIACLVGEMSAGFSLGEFATKSDGVVVKRILDTAGSSFEVEEERLDIITALSGSAPAFIAYFLDACITAGIRNGLSREQAETLSVRTALGTAKLMLEKKLSPKELIEMVASKGGTTEAGLRVFEKENLNSIVINAIEKAEQRSKEMRIIK